MSQLHQCGLGTSTTNGAALLLQQSELPLRSSMAYAVGGQLGYVLTQLMILAALARLRGPDAVGEFGLALALTTPFFMFAGMGGKSAQASDVTHRYSFAEYAGLMMLAGVAAAVASITTGLIFATSHALFIIIIVAITKVFEAVSNLAYGAFQQAGRVDWVATSLVLRGFTTVPIFVGLLLLGLPIGAAFTAQLLVWSTCALFLDYPRASSLAAGKLVWPSMNIRRLARLMRETTPLGGSYLLNSLLVSLPRLYVERTLGLSAVGLLTVVNYFQQAGTILANSLSQMLVSRFARLRLAGADDQLRGVAAVVFAVAAFCSIAGVLLAYFAGEWVLRTLFGPPFAAAEGLLIVIAIAVSAKLFSMVPQSLLHAQRRFWFFLAREAASVAVCVTLLFALVPAVGLIGAGYAIAGAFVFRLAIMVAAVRVKSGERGSIQSVAFDPAGVP